MRNDRDTLFCLTCMAISHCSCVMTNEMRRPNWRQPVRSSGKETTVPENYHTITPNAIIEQDSAKAFEEVRYED